LQLRLDEMLHLRRIPTWVRDHARCTRRSASKCDLGNGH